MVRSLPPTHPPTNVPPTRDQTIISNQLTLRATVIHIVLSLDAGISDIPLLLSGKTPTPAPSSNTSSGPSENLGSQNYAKKPVAVAVGGGFDDEMFEQMKAATEGKEVVWVRADPSKMAGMPELGDVEAYAAASAARVKRCLGGLGVGVEGGKREGVFYY